MDVCTVERKELAAGSPFGTAGCRDRSLADTVQIALVQWWGGALMLVSVSVSVLPLVPVPVLVLVFVPLSDQSTLTGDLQVRAECSATLLCRHQGHTYTT